MNRLKIATAALAVTLPLLSCASYNAYQKAHTAEKRKNWDEAIIQYEKALDVNPDNTRFRIDLERAKLAASRIHFEKGKTLQAAANAATGGERMRLGQLAASELELTVKLDPTNQYAAVEFGKAVSMIQDAQQAADGSTIEEHKRRMAKSSKAQPPVLNPASDDPISLSFPRETPVRDIYRALANAFGINILFDQAVKDDRITIELKDVTAQQALERVMQAATHFYKVLDEHTIIIVPDNPQARRDYEDLVIRTFYLSNGDAEQVTNVVRTMIEARNVFPLKALNAITIRDTADKVMIAEKIIEANDKAKSEVVVDVELLQLDVGKLLDLGPTLSAYQVGIGLATPTTQSTTSSTDSNGATTTANVTTAGPANIDFFRALTGKQVNFTIPTATYNFVKNATQSEQLANPQLRISEGEKATLHIGKRIPVPVTTFSSVSAGTNSTYAPATSFQYQDVGIKVSIEPRVHHNREVTLKLTVEVSDQSGSITSGGVSQPIISTRTIESTIRLKDGETNFLAGLIQRNDTESGDKIPFLGDIPLIGRLFNHQRSDHARTDLMLTMTPHIIRVPEITDDDLAPMWVGTLNNLTFRGVSPRVQSQSSVDPFSGGRREQMSTVVAPVYSPSTGTYQLSSDGEPGNYIVPQGGGTTAPPAGPTTPTAGSGPTDPFSRPTPSPAPAPNTPGVDANGNVLSAPVTNSPRSLSISTASVGSTETTTGTTAGVASMASTTSSFTAPRIAPQPSTLSVKPGEQKVWNVVGMDLDGLEADQLVLHFDPRAIDVSDVMLGPALFSDPASPPAVTISRDTGTIRVVSTDGQPLRFEGGGEILMIRLRGGNSGQTSLVIENPSLRNRGKGSLVMSAVSGGQANVQ